jgi:hypothetical protein
LLGDTCEILRFCSIWGISFKLFTQDTYTS